MSSSEGIETKNEAVHLLRIIALCPWLVTVEKDTVGVDYGLQTSAKIETLYVFAAPNGLLQKECFILPAVRNSFTDASPVFSD
jgi:hypothetical protein